MLGVVIVCWLSYGVAGVRNFVVVDPIPARGE